MPAIGERPGDHQRPGSREHVLGQLQGLVQELPTPLSAVLARFIRLQIDRPRTSPAEPLKVQIERTVRFIAWSLYNAMLQTGAKLPRPLRSRLAGWREGTGQAERLGTMLEHTTGPLLIIANRLATEVLEAKLSPPFILRGAEWVRESLEVLDQLNRIRLDGKRGDFGIIGLLDECLPSLNGALANLGRLQWALVARESTQLRLLRGPHRGCWTSLPEGTELPPDSISLAPVAGFSPDSGELHVFQTPNHGFLTIGPESTDSDIPTRATTNGELAAIREHCPVHDWVRAAASRHAWQGQCNLLWDTQGFSFSDRAEELSGTLYGREADCDLVAARVRGLLREGRRLLALDGPLGVGKSAFAGQLAERLQAQGLSCVSYFFKQQDRRCAMDFFYQAAVIRIASQWACDPPSSATWESRFLETLEAVVGALKEGRARLWGVVMLLDGADELRRQNPRDFTKLLATARTTHLPGIQWVLIGRPIPEFAQLAEQDLAEVCHLRPLQAPAQQMLLESELPASLSGGERIAFIQRVMANPDAGLPLFLRDVLRTYPREPHGTLTERWAQEVESLGHSSLDALAVLSVAYEPLPERDIAAILGSSPEVARQALAPWCFEQKGECWSITPHAFGDFVRSSDAAGLDALRARATNSMIEWASNWRAAGSHYPLQFLPRHLERAARAECHQALRTLSKDPAFLAAQARAFPGQPELPAETLLCALRSTCDPNAVAVAEMFTLALLHAKQRMRLSRVSSIVGELRRGNHALASRLAGLLEDDQEEVIWQILTAMGALSAGEPSVAREILSQIRVPERARGARGRYEDLAGVALGALVGAGVRAVREVDLTGVLERTASALLGERGRQRLFGSLEAAPDATLVPLLPTGNKERRRALSHLARALGRARRIDAALDLAHQRESPEDELLLAAAEGAAEVGEIEGAGLLSRSIRRRDLRAQALCCVASRVAGTAQSVTDVVLWLREADGCWGTAREPGPCAAVPTGAGEAECEVEPLLATLVRRATEMGYAVQRARTVALLGVVQAKWSLSGDSLLARAELLAGGARSPAEADFALLAVLRAYLQARDFESARQVGGRIRLRALRTMAEGELRGSSLGAESLDPDQVTGDEGRSLADTCDLAAGFSRAGCSNLTLDVLSAFLARSHSAKAEEPARWGIPRLLGEIAALFLTQGEVEVGAGYFAAADRLLERLPSQSWDVDRSWGLVNLARARLSVGDEEAVVAAFGLLQKSRLVARRASRHRAARAHGIAEILAEIWVLLVEHAIEGSDELLNEAVAYLASPGVGPVERIRGVIELARREARLTGADAAAARLRAVAGQARELGGATWANFLIGKARCGVLEGLDREIAEATEELADTPLAFVRRAEVERLAQLGQLTAAERQLSAVGDPLIRAKAARDVAVKLAQSGQYAESVRVTQERIGAKRGELVADVAHAIALDARATASRKDEARHAFPQLVLEGAPYLDSTYLLLSHVVASRVYPELGCDVLRGFADSMLAEGVAEEESSPAKP